MSTNIESDERLLSARVVAHQLGVTANTVKSWARAGKIASVRLSARCIRFDPDAVAAFLAQSKAVSRG